VELESVSVVSIFLQLDISKARDVHRGVDSGPGDIIGARQRVVPVVARATDPNGSVVLIFPSTSNILSYSERGREKRKEESETI